jgi:hypothetical protein
LNISCLRIERPFWEQEVVSSNLAAPTPLKFEKSPDFQGFFASGLVRPSSASIRKIPPDSEKTVHFWQLVWQLF